MSYGMEWDWLTTLLGGGGSMPQVPASVPIKMPPTPVGAMPISPEMGGGAQRMLGAQTVDALGPSGSYVNAASAVSQGQQPGLGDMLKDQLGIGTPNGTSEIDAKKMMDALIKMMATQQQGGQKGQGAAPPMQPLPQPGPGGVAPQRHRPLPRYPWSPQRAPGLLYDGP